MVWINRDPIEEAGGLSLYAFLPTLGGSGKDPFGLCDPGDKRNKKLEVALVPHGHNPNQVEAIPVLADLAEDVKAFGIILAAVETAGASAVGPSEAVATGLKGAMEVGSHPSGLSDTLKKVASKALKQQADGGVVPYMRITYQECEPVGGLLGGLFSLFGGGNTWVDKSYPEEPEGWVQYKGPSDLPGSVFLDPKEALRKALEQGRKMLQEFEKQKKASEEGGDIDL